MNLNQFYFGWIAVAIFTFLYLLKQPAPYGRHSSTQWGPMMSNKWGWVIMESFVLVVLYGVLFYYNARLNLQAWVMIGLFTFHYMNRSFVFPFRLKTAGKKMPVIIALSAMLFNLVNGLLIGNYFAKDADYPESWFLDIRFISGLFVFLSGMFINWQSDNILLSLRKPGETGYKIPTGGFFKYVSCPNLFGEIIEWLGFALLTWSIPGLIFFVWTCANVIPRAIAHHHWYKNKFPDYPAARKAVIPFGV